MYQGSKRTCTAIVKLIKPFVWWRSVVRKEKTEEKEARAPKIGRSSLALEPDGSACYAG